jgi:tetratricopeptide (TPR) repeat protein
MKTKFLLLLMILFAGSGIFAKGITDDFTKLVPQNTIPKYGKDSVKCIMNLSLYIEPYKYWKQSRYKSEVIKDAIKPWSYVFNNCPRASQNALIHGVKIMEYRIQHAQSDEEKEKYIDTLMMVYDKRIKYFPTYKGRSQVGKILGDKGVDLYKYRPSDYKQAYEILKQSIDDQKDKAKGSVYIYYFRSLIRMVQNSEADPALLVDAYDQISDYLDANIKKYKNAGKSSKVEIYENIKGSIESMFEPYAKCEDLVRIYEKKYEENPNDVELLKKVIKILDKKKCVDSELYLNAIESLHKLEPTPESAFLLGKMYLKNENYDKALEYLQEATKMTNPEDLYDNYMYLAEIYRYKNNYPKAREMALKATKYDDTKGQPYAFIGDLYAASAQKCGDNDLTKLVAYWPAVDMYVKAKSVEPDMAEAMNKRIAAYSKHFPTKEVLFFYNINEGDSYTVGCWINAKTTVRAAK